MYADKEVNDYFPASQIIAQYYKYMWIVINFIYYLLL